MIPTERQRLRQPSRPRPGQIVPPSVEGGVSLQERHAQLDAALPYVVLQYAESRLHAVVGPFLNPGDARAWATANTAEPATGYRLMPVSRVTPLLPAPPVWSR